MANLKTAHVKFADSKYNYSTSVNGRLDDNEIIKYFKGTVFNLGGITCINGNETEVDNLQKCIDCIVEPLNL